MSTTELSGVCIRHPFERAEHVCRGCGLEFCSDDVVYPFGPKKPPYCVTCAIRASGVRSTAAAPKMSRREIRKRMKEMKHRRSNAPVDDSPDPRLPVIHDPFEDSAESDELVTSDSELDERTTLLDDFLPSRGRRTDEDDEDRAIDALLDTLGDRDGSRRDNARIGLDEELTSLRGHAEDDTTDDDLFPQVSADDLRPFEAEEFPAVEQPEPLQPLALSRRDDFPSFDDQPLSPMHLGGRGDRDATPRPGGFDPSDADGFEQVPLGLSAMGGRDLPLPPPPDLPAPLPTPTLPRVAVHATPAPNRSSSEGLTPMVLRRPSTQPDDPPAPERPESSTPPAQSGGDFWADLPFDDTP